MSAISYAQAAKGQAVVQASSQPVSGSPPSTASHPKNEVPVANSTSVAPSVASNDAESRDTAKNGNPDAETVLSRQDSELIEESAPSTVSAADQSTKSSRESDVTTADSLQQQDEKASRSASRTSRSNDGPDGRKGRKGKKARNHDKEAQTEQQQQEEKEAEKVVLSEAPLPAVNIWKQRQEHRAKQAPTAVSISAHTSTNGNDVRKPHGSDGGDSPHGSTKDKSPKKVPDQARNGDHSQRRSGPRGARGNDKDDKPAGNLPPVEDTSAWPDPKSAATADVLGQKPQVKSAGVEREAREETRQSQTRWQKLEVQHSAVYTTFNGPKPRGGARGGRASGSTRESQSNTTTTGTSNANIPHAASDKTASPNGTSASKGSTTHPRENNAGSSRAPSQATPLAASKRGSVDAPVSKEHRKPSASPQESSREAAVDHSAPSNKKSTSQRPAQGDVRTINTEHGSATTKSDRPKASESGKEGPNTSNSQQYGTREGRPERTRGGYRGRGGHNIAAGQHLQQNSFTQNVQYGIPSFQPRQNSAGPATSHSGQIPGYGQHARARGGPRWNGSASGRSTSNGTPYAPRPNPNSQISEMPISPYHPYPYPPPVYDSMIPIIKGQVEYYLSVENLCKDYYLRKHMDSQGFVKLHVIAGFKRIRDLLTSNGGGPDLLRAACAHSDLIEFVLGEDSVDRVRNREKWGKFILKSSERIEELQNDTKIKFTPYPKHTNQAPPFVNVIPQHYAVTSPVGMYPAFTEDQGVQASYMNGQYEQNGAGPNGHPYGADTQLSAGVPDFQPSFTQPSFTLESLNNITDALVEKLIILEKAGSDSGPSGEGAAGYISNKHQHPGMNGVSSKIESPRYAVARHHYR